MARITIQSFTKDITTPSHVTWISQDDLCEFVHG